MNRKMFLASLLPSALFAKSVTLPPNANKRPSWASHDFKCKECLLTQPIIPNKYEYGKPAKVFLSECHSTHCSRRDHNSEHTNQFELE